MRRPGWRRVYVARIDRVFAKARIECSQAVPEPPRLTSSGHFRERARIAASRGVGDGRRPAAGLRAMLPPLAAVPTRVRRRRCPRPRRGGVGRRRYRWSAPRAACPIDARRGGLEVPGGFEVTIGVDVVLGVGEGRVHPGHRRHELLYAYAFRFSLDGAPPTRPPRRSTRTASPCRYDSCRDFSDRISQGREATIQ